jgi:hypothetical protein
MDGLPLKGGIAVKSKVLWLVAAFFMVITSCSYFDDGFVIEKVRDSSRRNLDERTEKASPIALPKLGIIGQGAWPAPGNFPAGSLTREPALKYPYVLEQISFRGKTSRTIWATTPSMKSFLGGHYPIPLHNLTLVAVAQHV